MEIMEKILDDVRRDAIEKLKAADTTENIHILADAVIYIYSLAKTNQLYGCSAVEQAVKDSPSGFFRFICTFLSDPYDSDDAITLVTNEYWSRNPQGVQAMAEYIYIRTALSLPDLYLPYCRYLFQSLLLPVPGRLYREMEKTGLEMESRHAKEISESFSHIIWPVFQDAETLENIRALESAIDRLSDWYLQRLLREMDVNTVSACISVSSENIRNRVIQNLSLRVGTSIKETAIQLHPISEKTASQSITNMLHVLGRMEASGEISIR